LRTTAATVTHVDEEVDGLRHGRGRPPCARKVGLRGPLAGADAQGEETHGGRARDVLVGPVADEDRARSTDPEALERDAEGERVGLAVLAPVLVAPHHDVERGVEA
jgi:hypothetical protein